MSKANFIDSLITGKKDKTEKKDNTEAGFIKKLYIPPKKDKGKEQPTFPRITPNMWQQADILFLPNDKGYEYCLVVVDVGSRFVDAEPLKDKKSETVVTAILKIYKRKIISKPRVITVDAGSEFKTSFVNAMAQIKVDVDVTKVGRHRQVALVERKNQTIGKVVHQLITNDELETGHSSSKWVEYLPMIVKAINKKIASSTPKNTIKSTGNPIYTTADLDLLELGDKVRIPLDEPKNITTNKKLNGRFRSGDVRWVVEPTYITKILMKPNTPIMYMVASQPHVGYTRNQIQLVDKDEVQPKKRQGNVENRFTVKKLLDKKIEKGIVKYLVQWEGLPKNESSWEKRSSLIEDIPRMIANFDKNH